MTEFEFVYLLNELNNTMWTHIMNFTSIIFAMLVTAYFIGPKLTKVMTWTILSLFSLGAALFAGSTLTARNDIVALASASRKTLLADQSPVPSLNMFNASDAEIMAMDIGLHVMLALAYIATLVFFMQARKQGAAKLPIDLD